MITTKLNQNPPNWYFTFNHGPRDRDIVVIKGNFHDAQEQMNAIFKDKWRFQYTEEQGRALAKKLNLRRVYIEDVIDVARGKIA